MKSNHIIVVSGEPKSIFLEIFFRALKHKKYKSPIILICNKNFLIPYIKKINFKKKIKQESANSKTVKVLSGNIEMNEKFSFINELFNIKELSVINIAKGIISPILINSKRAAINNKIENIKKYFFSLDPNIFINLLIFLKNIQLTLFISE